MRRKNEPPRSTPGIPAASPVLLRGARLCSRGLALQRVHRRMHRDDRVPEVRESANVLPVGGEVMGMRKKLSKDEYLQESIERIEENRYALDCKPFSKTLIELRLRAIAEKYGHQTANRIIDDMGLEKYGWKKEAVDLRLKSDKRAAMEVPLKSCMER